MRALSMSAVAVGISRRNCEPRTTDFLMSASMLLTSRRTEDLRTLVRTFSVRSPMTISESGLMRSTLPSSKPTSARALEKVRTRSPLASRIPSCPPFQARSVARWISTRPEMKVRVAKRCSTRSASSGDEVIRAMRWSTERRTSEMTRPTMLSVPCERE